MSRVIPPDVALWLVGYLREQLSDEPGLQVGVRVPDGYDGSHPLIVVRDDGGAQSDRVVFDRSFGVTVHKGPRDDPKPCRDLAALAYGVLTDDRIGYMAGSPIAAVMEGGCNGVYPASGERPECMYYMTVAYTAVPDNLNHQ
ncbi:hypothetical protein [Bifidobacterium pseudolongum]|uniref:Tail terminator n=1 Tax=Bifidobacterium pseudolongum subsp. globosum TaxID=1690 RepID=A0A4Q5AAH7_9BIFI|nr:hypothetical protein [Bifidobacterium pseudolongum]RYQ20893.1 hypothetical protein PG2071B_0314 [Bifidobacterium pseudolongum subsp. globosum]